MTEGCGAAGSGFIGSMTGAIDCSAQTLGSGAWSALATPGSTLIVVLSGMLTIVIAMIGYNLLFGSSLTVRGTTLAFVKIGAVFSLATSWPAYRTLVYDLVTSGPDKLVHEIGPRAGVVGSDGTLVQRLDVADRQLVRLAVLGAGNAPAYAYDNIQPPPFMGFDSFALGGSRILFLIASIASLSVVRVIAGLLLALGPFFIAFLLFDNTRSLFEGWVRVLAGAAIASAAVSILLGVELGIVEPWLGAVLARRTAGEALPSMPTELFVMTCLFGLMLLVLLYACFRLTAAFRLAPLLRTQSAASGARKGQRQTGTERPRVTHGAQGERSRAAAVASVLRAQGGRDEGRSALTGGAAAVNERTAQVRPAASDGARQAVPLGRTFNRKPGTRVSALAAKRDGTR